MAPIKRVPLRKCTGCGEKFKKLDLIRVVRTPQGGVEIDRTGKMAGRGAYICRDVECFKRSRKARRLEANLECKIPEEIYDAIEAEIARAEVSDEA